MNDTQHERHTNNMNTTNTNDMNTNNMTTNNMKIVRRPTLFKHRMRHVTQEEWKTNHEKNMHENTSTAEKSRKDKNKERQHHEPKKSLETPSTNNHLDKRKHFRKVTENLFHAKQEETCAGKHIHTHTHSQHPTKHKQHKYIATLKQQANMMNYQSRHENHVVHCNHDMPNTNFEIHRHGATVKISTRIVQHVVELSGLLEKFSVVIPVVSLHA